MRFAAVTGASGMIGGLIVKGLLDAGWSVRVLTRSDWQYTCSRVSVLSSDINDEDGLRRLLKGVNAVFHCAAELNNGSKMYSTNVEGTGRLLKLVKETKISYFCYLSSAAVVGATSIPYVSEEIPCDPTTLYGKTKYAAEEMVMNANLDMNVCVLRPTNVVSQSNIGILSVFIPKRWMDKVRVYVQGRESAHLVYAKDVANAALFFIGRKFSEPSIYFVSCDSDKNNTVVGIYNLYQSIMKNKRGFIRFTFPEQIPHFFRKLYRGKSLHGKVRFSSEKLQNEGFLFEYGVERILTEVFVQRIQS